MELVLRGTEDSVQLETEGTGTMNSLELESQKDGMRDFFFCLCSFFSVSYVNISKCSILIFDFCEIIFFTHFLVSSPCSIADTGIFSQSTAVIV